MLRGKYRLHDIAQRIDRDKSTIIRWEKQGLISQAKRDSRGWRYYSSSEVKKIVNQAKLTNYFQDKEKLAALTDTKAKKISYASVTGVVLFMLYSLLNLSLVNVMASETATTTVYVTISAGILDVVDSSSSISFDSALNFSFSAQTATMTKLPSFRVQDARGSFAGWGVDLSSTDWKSGEDVMQLDYDGSGTTGDYGQLCVIVANGAISQFDTNGADTTGNARGTDACFSSTSAVTAIDLYDFSNPNGGGDYFITDFKLEQFIPSSPTSQSYTTTITLTTS